MASISEPTAFFGKTDREALRLLAEARDYLAYLEPFDRGGLVPSDRLRLCLETMRLTARMTHVMAWLLAQRAVLAGEIALDQALGHEALAEVEICMGGEESDWSGLPPRLVALLERSHRLYQRVARLDGLARRRSA